jgi:hypothetical protein
VHVELHTGDQAAASAFYVHFARLAARTIEARSGSYLALELGGGIVECCSRAGPPART